jgi:EAL domain-containing protein (putative c-di-GMP-specific phosphodiesterase class I)
VLFQYAARKQRLPDLEFACLGRAMDSAAELPPGALLFVNIHPDVFASGAALRKTIVSRAHDTEISLDRIVLEITEQGSLKRTPIFLQTIEELRALGVRFGFDDVGVAYSHLPLIGDVRPSFLKISQHFGTAFETDSTRMKIVMNLLSLARDFNSELIVEGIEHQSTAETAAELGIPYGQGFLFGHPAEASSFITRA